MLISSRANLRSVVKEGKRGRAKEWIPVFSLFVLETGLCYSVAYSGRWQGLIILEGSI